MNAANGSQAAARALPEWVTSDLIAETIEVWQPKYSDPLTEHDAIEILLNVAALLDAIGDADVDAVPGPGESF
jgi:hypothetical protein